MTAPGRPNQQEPSMSVMVPLLPCPFCGGAAEIEQHGDRRKSTIYSCNSCGCRLETGEEWGHGKRWNERAADAAISLCLGEAARVVDECASKWETLRSSDFPETNDVSDFAVVVLQEAADRIRSLVKTEKETK